MENFEATHIGIQVNGNKVLMKRGKRGQWMKFVYTNNKNEQGRWEGINYLIDDVNPKKITEEK